MGETLTIIALLGLVIWNLIDFFKVYWKDAPYSRWITLGASALMSFGCAFTFNLDIINAIIPSLPVSILGTIITALSLMGGSSFLSKLFNGIGKIKDGELPQEDIVEETVEKE